MNKKFWALMLVLPLCTFCGGKDNPQPEPEPEPDPEIVISGDKEFNRYLYVQCRLDGCPR